MSSQEYFVSDFTCGPCETALIDEKTDRLQAQCVVDFLLGENEQAYQWFISVEGEEDLQHAVGCIPYAELRGAIECAKMHKDGKCIVRFSNYTRTVSDGPRADS